MTAARAGAPVGRRMPSRPMCPACNSLRHEWKAMSGRGTIWSFVVAHPPLLPAYAELAPYNVVVVALDEVRRYASSATSVASPGSAINEIDPATIMIGERVQVVFQKMEDVLTRGPSVGSRPPFNSASLPRTTCSFPAATSAIPFARAGRSKRRALA